MLVWKFRKLKITSYLDVLIVATKTSIPPSFAGGYKNLSKIVKRPFMQLFASCSKIMWKYELKCVRYAVNKVPRIMSENVFSLFGKRNISFFFSRILFTVLQFKGLFPSCSFVFKNKISNVYFITSSRCCYSLLQTGPPAIYSFSFNSAHNILLGIVANVWWVFTCHASLWQLLSVD